MSQYQRLLLIINPALRLSPTIQHAGALARASGASLHVVALVKSPGILSLLEDDNWATARDEYLQEQRDWLEQQVQRLQERGVAPDAAIAIVTSDFHTLRAGGIAERRGYGQAFTVGAPTPATIRANAWLREYFAVISGWVLGEF